MSIKGEKELNDFLDIKKYLEEITSLFSISKHYTSLARIFLLPLSYSMLF